MILPRRKTRPAALGLAVFGFAVLLATAAVEASNTYRPPLPARLNKAYLTGQKLWKSKKLVGPNGQTCADCHDGGGKGKNKGRKSTELLPIELIKKRPDLPKLIYFELVTHVDNNMVRPNGPEVEALEVYMVERYQLEKRRPPAANDSLGQQLVAARDLYSDGDYSQALSTLEEILAAGPERDAEAEAHLLLGVIAHVLGDSTRARAEFYATLQLRPDVRLDPEIFSPKTIEVFESVRAAVTTQEEG